MTTPAEEQPQQQQPPPPPFFAQLPELVLAHLLTFLEQWDGVGPLLQLSTACRTAVAPTIQQFKMSSRALDQDTRDQQALGRLLGRLTHLRRLDVRPSMLTDAEKAALVRALGPGGAAGRWLEYLHLDGVDGDTARLLRGTVGRGGVPGLQTLHVNLRELEYDAPDQIVRALAEALEARRDLLLPPVPHVEGLGNCRDGVPVSAHLLRRLWDACPAERCVFLDASGQDALEKLGNFMLDRPGGFPALRFLSLTGCRTEEQGSAAAVLRVVEKGLTPALEKLDIIGLNEGLNAVGQALAAGRLPRLATLGLAHHGLGPGEFARVTSGLLAGPTVLRKLVLYRMSLSRADVMSLAHALTTAGGGLRELRALVVYHHSGSSLDPALEALASGAAPCARTLGRIELAGLTHASMSARAVRGLIVRGLGGGGFPNLTELLLNGEAAAPAAWTQLMDALLALAERGTPARLRLLHARNEGFRIDCLDEVTPVFAAGGLPFLYHLQVEGGYSPRPVATRFPEDWAALGDRIRVEGMNLQMHFERDVFRRILTAIGGLAFCPRLRRVYMINPDPDYIRWLKDALDTRWARREAIAALRGGGLTTPGDFVARFEEAGAPLRRAEAQIEGMEAERQQRLRQYEVSRFVRLQQQLQLLQQLEY